MADAGFLGGDKSKRLYLAGRAAAVCIGILSGSISLAVGVHRVLPLLVDYGPALVVHEVVPIGVYREGGKIGFVFDKKRACFPKASSVTATDAAGETYVGKIEWPATFPVRDGLSATMNLRFAAGIPPGYYRNVIAELWHDDCADGGKDPRKPVVVKVPAFLVSP